MAAATTPPVRLFFPALRARARLRLERVSNAILTMRDDDGRPLAVAEGDGLVLRPELARPEARRGRAPSHAVDPPLRRGDVDSAGETAFSLYTQVSLGTDGTFALLRESWRDH